VWETGSPCALQIQRVRGYEVHVDITLHWKWVHSLVFDILKHLILGMKLAGKQIMSPRSKRDENLGRREENSAWISWRISSITSHWYKGEVYCSNIPINKYLESSKIEGPVKIYWIRIQTMYLGTNVSTVHSWFPWRRDFVLDYQFGDPPAKGRRVGRYGKCNKKPADKKGAGNKSTESLNKKVVDLDGVSNYAIFQKYVELPRSMEWKEQG
jgi:hypothetical protein